MKKLIYILAIALIGAVLISGCVGTEKTDKISVTGTVNKGYNINPMGYGGMGDTYYEVEVIINNNGPDAITIDKLDGYFIGGEQGFQSTITPLGQFRIIMPGKSDNYQFNSMGRTDTIISNARAAGKNVIFGVIVYDEKGILGKYGIALPPFNTLDSVGYQFEFEKID